jgi:hypothetical protein
MYTHPVTQNYNKKYVHQEFLNVPHTGIPRYPRFRFNPISHSVPRYTVTAITLCTFNSKTGQLCIAYY